MPLEFVTNSFLPSEEAQGAQSLKKLCCLPENQTAMFGTKGAQVTQVDSICLCLEGLSFLMLSR
jgi:hypothetical protein